MDVEDRIRDAVREDRPEPSVQFNRRVMAGLPEHTSAAHRAIPTFPVFLRFAAVALVAIVAIGAVGLPMILSKPDAAGPSSSANNGGLATSSLTSVSPSQAGPRGVPTVAPIVSHAPSRQFTVTGSPQYLYQNATLLNNGEVLVCGGYDDLAQRMLSEAALYNPATGKFTPTGSLPEPRAGATATRLLDGRVLIVGGSNANYQQLGSAEIYDPATGKFTATGSLKSPRQSHTATLLEDGRVLIAGGLAENPIASASSSDAIAMSYHTSTDGRTRADGMTLEKGTLRSAEMYDPKTGQFSSAGSMTEARFDFAATLLTDGRVLIVGNASMDKPTDKSAELYNPKTGRFTRTGSMNVARMSEELTVLKGGLVLVTDGALDGKSSEFYNPKTGKFTVTGSLNAPHGDYPATLLPDGRILLVGGTLMPGGNATSIAEAYDPKTGQFTLVGYMNAARDFATAVRLQDGRVLIMGGTYAGPGGWVGIRSAELYTP